METWDTIRARRNVREFTEQPLADEDLERILEAGRRAPSAGNVQAWDFIVVRDRDQLIELSGVWQGAGHIVGSQATIAFVLPKQESRLSDVAFFDVGHAVMSMMLMATDLGLGTCHSSIGDQDLAKQILGFPENHFGAFLMSIGHPADRPIKVINKPARRPFDEVVHWNSW